MTSGIAVEDGEVRMVPFARTFNGADADDVSLACLYSVRRTHFWVPLGQMSMLAKSRGVHPAGCSIPSY